MHPLIVLAAAHAAHPAHVTHAAARAGAIAAGVIVATAIIIVLKVIARILSPKKKAAARPSSPYAAPVGRK